MQTSSPVAPTIEDVTNRIVASGRITRADEHFLLRVATSGQTISDHDMSQVKHVLDRLKMGLLRVTD